MKVIELMTRAEAHREQMQASLDAVNKKLVALLGQSEASVFYQHSDGWCVLFSEDHNAHLSSIDIESLLSMSRSQALSYLHARSI